MHAAAHLAPHLKKVSKHSNTASHAHFPRFCCSSKAVELAVNLGVISRLSDMIVDADIAPVIRTRASEVLALLCADKKKGPEVRTHFCWLKKNQGECKKCLDLFRTATKNLVVGSVESWMPFYASSLGVSVHPDL